jgi:hypothetical protein
MNPAIKTKIVADLSALEQTLFTLHRDCGDHAEFCSLGVAWISVKEAKIALVQDPAARQGILGGTAQGKSEPAQAVVNVPDQPNVPTVVCLCGSMRFYEAFRRAEYAAELSGQIALLPAFSPDVADHKHGGNVAITAEQKTACDEIHKRKIDISDEILVLNVGGYVGESTWSEIRYARQTGKRVRWLEPELALEDYPSVDVSQRLTAST